MSTMTSAVLMRPILPRRPNKHDGRPSYLDRRRARRAVVLTFSDSGRHYLALGGWPGVGGKTLGARGLGFPIVPAAGVFELLVSLFGLLPIAVWISATSCCNLLSCCSRFVSRASTSPDPCRPDWFRSS